jgi:hypothetical protein
MNKTDHFKLFVLCSGDMTADVDDLHVKRIHLVSFFYIVIEDLTSLLQCNRLYNVKSAS